MVNPFDRTFFQLMLGFSLILSFSFAILFFVGRYSASQEEKEYAVVEKARSLDK